MTPSLSAYRRLFEDHQGERKILQFRDTRESWNKFPPTKAGKLLKTLGIKPDWGYWYYDCPELVSETNVPSEPYVLIHTEGVHCKDRKDLDPTATASLVNTVKEAGLLPIVLGKDRTPKDVPELYKLLHHSKAILGIDSGPEHFALALDKPTIIFWKGHEPQYCIDPSFYLMNVVPKPKDHRSSDTSPTTTISS